MIDNIKWNDGKASEPETEPKTAFQLIDEEIRDWEVIRKEYILLQKQSATIIEYHALAGGMALIKDFQKALRQLKKDIKELEGE